MENNSSNNLFFITSNGRYLGISDGYFLSKDNPNFVCCYCKPCWIKEIKKLLPKIGISVKGNKSKISNLNKKIKKLNNSIKMYKKKIKNKKDEIKELNKINKNEGEPKGNLVCAPIVTNNFEVIFDKNIADLEIEKIKNLLKSSEFNEISNIDDLLSYNAIHIKTMEEFNIFCRNTFKEIIKKILEKVNMSIEKVRMNINNTSMIVDEFKKKLNIKEIPENVLNESILPLKKYMDDESKKMDKMIQTNEELKKTFKKILG